jgi:hypothetical protein
MKNGVIDFVKPENCKIKKFIRKMDLNEVRTCGLNDKDISDEMGWQI